MNIGTISGRAFVTVAQNTPLSEVAHLMSSAHVGAVIVTEGGGDQSRLVGMVTDRDIVSAQLQTAKDLTSLSAGAVMTRNLLTLSPDESIDGAITHMRARGVRRAPVVSAQGIPLALITTDDLISHVSCELVSIAGIVAQQSQHERVIAQSD
jgi:CBS domain-containing protein